MNSSNQIFRVDPKTRDVTYSRGERVYSTDYYAYRLTDNLMAWLKKHIKEPFSEEWPTGAIRTFPLPISGTTMTAHTDHRNWKFLYGIQLGGEQANTTFWREPGVPLLRPKDMGLPRIPPAQDTLEMVAMTPCEVGKWHLLNGHVLHGATGITGERLFIHVAFDQFPELAK